MENAGILYGHLEYCMVIWNIVWSFGIFFGHLVHFMAIWLCCGNLVYFPTFWYIVSKKIWQTWCGPEVEEINPDLESRSRLVLNRS
jgi:hypothetical protein